MTTNEYVGSFEWRGTDCTGSDLNIYLTFCSVKKLPRTKLHRFKDHEKKLFLKVIFHKISKWSIFFQLVPYLFVSLILVEYNRSNETVSSISSQDTCLRRYFNIFKHSCDRDRISLSYFLSRSLILLYHYTLEATRATRATRSYVSFTGLSDILFTPRATKL